MRASQVIKRARAEIGYTETPAGSNRTKYGVWYGMNGQPWCAIFISWLFRDALRLIGGKHAYTPTFAAWFKKAGQWGTEPRVGAIAFFDFPDNVNRIQHVELVVGVPNSRIIETVGGNTSSGNSGSQSNGGGVFARTRESVVGYGYPRYEPEPIPSPVYWVDALVSTPSGKATLVKFAQDNGVKLIVRAGDSSHAICSLHVDEIERVKLVAVLAKMGVEPTVYRSRLPADATVRRLNKPTSTSL